VTEGFEALAAGTAITTTNTDFAWFTGSEAPLVVATPVHSGNRALHSGAPNYTDLYSSWSPETVGPDHDVEQFWWMRWDDSAPAVVADDDVWEMHFDNLGDFAGGGQWIFRIMTKSNVFSDERQFTFQGHGNEFWYTVPRLTWVKFTVTYLSGPKSCRLQVTNGGGATYYDGTIAWTDIVSYPLDLAPSSQSWHICSFTWGGSGSGGQYYSWWDDFNINTSAGSLRRSHSDFLGRF
jgi:hypothetical protein